MKKLLVITMFSSLFLAYCKKDKKSLASVTTVAASNITATSVSTGGNVTDDGGSTVSKRGICWALNAGPTVSDSITTDGSGTGSFSSAIAGLSANTTYFMRAYAVNASGTSYGNEISLTTSGGLATVQTTPVTDIQPLSAKTGGNISNDGGASVTERGVVYSTTANPTVSNSKVVSGTGTGVYTLTLSPLASQQTYYVRAYAINSFGTSYGPQVQFNSASANAVTDIEGNVYPYVRIGNQDWTATNLKTTKYRNGDPVVNGFTPAGFDWYGTNQGAFTFPNGQVSKKDTFGLLYNVWAVVDNRGLCPTGWHVPSDAEWKTMEMNQGLSQTQADAGGVRGTVAAKLKEGGSSGLNLQLSGYVFPEFPAGGSLYDFGNIGFFLTSTANISGFNWYRAVYKEGHANAQAIERDWNAYGMSVRCIKD